MNNPYTCIRCGTPAIYFYKIHINNYEDLHARCSIHHFLRSRDTSCIIAPTDNFTVLTLEEFIIAKVLDD